MAYPQRQPNLQHAQTPNTKTLRVPVDQQMTIRDLAKAAMQRYLLSLHRLGNAEDPLCSAALHRGIAIQEVYVSPAANTGSRSGPGGGVNTPAVAYLMPMDYVVSVIALSTEMVVMRYQILSKPQAPTLRGAARQLRWGDGEVVRTESVDQQLPTHLPDAAVEEAEGFRQALNVIPAPHFVELGSSSLGEEGDNRADASNPTASDSTAELSMSGDEKEQQWRIAQSIVSLRAREERRMRWGPEAHHFFAQNYVSSPHKVMAGRFKYSKRRLQAPVVTAAPPAGLSRPACSFVPERRSRSTTPERLTAPSAPTRLHRREMPLTRESVVAAAAVLSSPLPPLPSSSVLKELRHLNTPPTQLQVPSLLSSPPTVAKTVVPVSRHLSFSTDPQLTKDLTSPDGVDATPLQAAALIL